MTLIIARKKITAVFGIMALQLTKVFQCSVIYCIYSMKQTSRFLTVSILSLVSLCVTAAFVKFYCFNVKAFCDGPLLLQQQI